MNERITFRPEEPHAMSPEEQEACNDLKSQITTLQEELKNEHPRKKRLHLKRSLGLLQSRLKKLERGDVGRRIPEKIAQEVRERDTGRDFGRPDHHCDRPGPPHHIRFFETFIGNHTRENPHTVENLEAPCKDCHNLAHALNIPSGTSIESFFKSFETDEWFLIEDLWKRGNTNKLRTLHN